MAKRSKRGLPVTIYFKQSEESLIDGLRDAIDDGKLIQDSGMPFKSFSQFIRAAMHEKLERMNHDSE